MPYKETMTPRERVMKALAREPVDRTPVANPTNVATVELMDLMVEPGRLDIAKALATDAIALCRGPKVLAMQCWLPRRHPYAGVLRHCGFAYTGRSVGIGCRTIGIPAEDAGCLTRPDARIHWMLGETDFA